MTVRRWVLGAVAFLTMLVMAAVVAVVVLIDNIDIKCRLIDAVQHATGRTLTADGPLRFTWSLWPTLRLDAARLSNLPGGSRPDMARAERIEAQISLPALLRHRIDVLQLRLVGPNVLFEVVDGKPNWVFTAPPGSGKPAQSSAAPFQLRIDAAHVQNGMVTWRLPTQTRVVGLRSFDVQHPQDGALDLGGTLVYQDNQPFTLHASARATAGLHDPWRTTIAFAAYDTTAHAQGTMTLGGDYDLAVDVRSATLDKLNALLPAMALPPVRGLVLSGHVTSNPLLGSLPVLGPLRLSLESADLSQMLPGLQLGRTELSLPAPGGKATLAGAGRYRGQDVTLTGTVGVPRQPEARNDVPIALAAKAEGSSVSLAGTVQVDRLGFAGLSATASLHASALAALRPMLTPALPALTAVGFDGQVAVPADAKSVRITGAKLTTQAGDLGGSGTIELGDGRAMLQAIRATLTSTQLDLDALLPAFDDPSAASGAGQPFADTLLPWTVTGGPSLDVTAAVATATFKGQSWRGAALTLQRGPARQAASFKVAMPNGPAEVSVAAEISARMPASLSIHAPGIPLALLAQYAGLPGPVTGAARVEMALHGGGRTVHEFAASLDGPISITAIGGQLTDAAFIKLAAASLHPLGIKVPQQGETALRCLGLIGEAKDGVVRLRTIALSSTYLSLSGAGQIDLKQDTVALKLHPLVQVGGSPVAVPVVVEGPFDAITGRLDASGLDKVGLLIDGLFGGDAPQTCSDAGLVPAHAASQSGSS